MEWLKGNKMYLLIAILVVITVAIFFLVPLDKDQSESGISDAWTENEADILIEDKQAEWGEDRISEEKERIFIDIKGAVASPGLYEAHSGDRVLDVVNQAGGLLETADQNNVNFAMRVVDEMVIYIPMLGEAGEPVAAIPGASPATASGGENLVNLNTASSAELETLPGVGPAKASAILEYRETNGRFRSIEELMEISGIGEKTFEKLKEHISVY